MPGFEPHRRLSDVAYEEAFRNLSFKPGNFTHEAHIRLVFIHLKKYGLDQATENMKTQIKAFAERWGANGKYNETITITAARIV